jgi:hypothetical protein
VSARQTRALAALQAALAERLKADATLRAAIGGRLHDGAPRAAVMPYLAFAEARGADFSASDGDGTRAALTIEAVDGEDGRGRALALVDRAVDLALDGPPLPLAEGRVVLIRLVSTTVARLPAGRGWRAGAVIEALVEG